MWNPITLKELSQEITATEGILDEYLSIFWQLIRIVPEKWHEETYGKEGFWVVAICGRKIIWYNDFEDGFNVGTYVSYGIIENYTCDQYELNQVVWQLYQYGRTVQIPMKPPGHPTAEE